MLKGQKDPKPAVGCSCPSFLLAEREGFLRSKADTWYLADQTTPGSSAGAGWAVLYGPEIIFCPFCGKRLGTKEGGHGNLT